MKNIVAIIISFFTLSIIQAQDNSESAKSDPVQIEYLGSWVPEWDNSNLVPSVTTFFENNKSENEEELREYKKKINKAKLEQKVTSTGLENQSKTTGAFNPVVEDGFNALTTQGIPSDNTIGVNTQNMLVLAVNSNLKYVNGNTGVQNASINLSTFFRTLSNGTLASSFVCDPKVIFDPIAKRFIVVAITCDFNKNSQVLIAFSKTESPTGGWNFYVYTGSPSAVSPNRLFFDYPKVAVSNSDLFISGNFFSASSQSSAGSGIYQINKSKGYAGSQFSSTDALVWHGLPGAPFTLALSNMGQSTSNIGDRMYAISTSLLGSTQKSSLLRVYEISRSVHNNPNVTLYNVTTFNSYSPPGDAVQQGTQLLLNTGDNRAMDAMWLNGVLHFVFHCLGQNGYTQVFYSRLTFDGSAWQSKDGTIAVNNVELAYPSIASAGYDENDQSVIIGMDLSSSKNYPSTAAVCVNHDWNVSNIILISQGNGSVRITDPSNPGTTRWGDYSGISRLMSASKPTLWFYGMAGNSTGGWKNYAARLTTGEGRLGNVDLKIEKSPISLFPNPVLEVWAMKFDTQDEGVFNAKLYSIDGKLYKDLFTQRLGKGTHEFRFNKADLPSGVYIVQLSYDGQELSSSQLSVQ